MSGQFDKIWDRWETDARKWDLTIDPSSPFFTECDKDDIVPMWVADMDFATPDCVINALKERLEHPILGYTLLSERYVNAIANWQEKRYGTSGVKREHILYQNSVLGGIASAMTAYTQPGDFVLTNQATYIGFQNTAKGLGRYLAFSDLVKDEQGIYRMNFEEMEKLIVAHNIPMMIFCSPHNPTGRVWEQWEIEKLVDLCHRYNVVLFSDEIWADFIIDPSKKHIPTQSVNDVAKHITIASYAPSKTFNLAGLIGSYTLCYNPFMNKKIENVGLATHYNNANVLSVVACCGAYEGGAEWVDEMIGYIRTNQEYMATFFKGCVGVDAYVPQGTYVMWVDVAHCGMDMDTVMKKLNQVGVIVNDGRPFRGATHLRFNLACPHTQVVKACEKMKQVFSQQ